MKPLNETLVMAKRAAALMTVLVVTIAVSAAAPRVHARDAIDFARDAIDFARDVQPILERSCVRCHGSKKAKAKLRLDSAGAIELGAGGDAVIVASDPGASVLYERISLPAGDADIMPPEGGPLSAEEIDIIRRWIESGARFGPASAAAPDERSTGDAAIVALRSAGASVLRIARNETGLGVSFRGLGADAGDDHLRLLEPIADRIVELDLSGTAITDLGMAALSGLIACERLHLARTAVGNKGVSRIASLPRLRHLNLFGTKIDDRGMVHLRRLASLEEVFLARTGVTSRGVQRLTSARSASPSASPSASGSAPSALRVDMGTEAVVEALVPAIPAPDPVNESCPVSGDAVDVDMYYVYHKHVIAFCRADCRARFVAEPERFREKVTGFDAATVPDTSGRTIQNTVASPVRSVVHEVLAADASKQRIALLDERGDVVWQASTDAIHDLQWLDSGNVLFQTSWTRIVEMTTAGEIVWEYDAALRNRRAGEVVEIHSFRRLADGVTMIAESGTRRIIEVDGEGELLRVIPLVVRDPHPHHDTRLARKLENGHYLVAHEGDGAVREYAPDGEVVWEYEVPLFDRPRKAGHGLDAWGNQVFAAIRLPNSNTLISTGNGHSVLEVNRERDIVWRLEQDDLTGIRLGWVTTLEVLPNGNYLIGNCHAGPDNPQIIEITREKRVVWTFRNFELFGDSLANSTLRDAHEDARFYRERVEPILTARCYSCHGDRDRDVEGELWLAARRNVVAGGHSGAIINFVEPEDSRLLRYVNHQDAERQMPPNGEKLAAAELAVLAEWVERGVPMTVRENEWTYEKPGVVTDEARRFWSFQPVRDPAVPQVRGDTAVGGNDIDGFVRARLAGRGLAPNPPADRISFLRRATYSVTGLPPTTDEIDAFLADDHPDAYERVVDRLLASPAYGEQWARHWLDLVRFAETNGYERDSAKPEAWKYRQYVIDSFNTDKPYDRFVIEQLAGDELAGDELAGDELAGDGRATGRGRAAAMADAAQGLDASSRAAAITATGYYRLGLWDDEPADREQALFDGLDDVVRTTSEVFLGLTMGCARCHDHKLDPLPQRDYYSMLAFFRNVRPYSGNAAHILTDVSLPEERAAAAKKNEEIQRRRDEITAELDELGARFAVAYARDTGEQIQPSDMSDLRFAYYRDTWTELPDFDMLKAETRGRVPGDLFDIGLATRGDSFGFVFEGRLRVPANGTYRFFLDSDDGARLLVDGEEVVVYDGIHGLGAERSAEVKLRKGQRRIRLEFFQGHGGKGLLVFWSGEDFERRRLSKADEADAARRLEQLLAEHGARLLGADMMQRYRELERELRQRQPIDPARMVLSIQEPSPEAPDTFVLTRGSAHAPAEKVAPAFPAVLTSASPRIRPRDRSSGRRLAFAEWLAGPDNPLTARVMVNRVWQYHFGRGLVRSASDFGTHGTPPTHPLLLDWLASRFIEDGWSLKTLHRRILLSATFRQSSARNDQAYEVDPNNDLLWRFDMRRLSAEEIRDSVLALTGKLDFEVGGPSVYPTIPAAILEGQSRNTWLLAGPAVSDTRRSLYTFIKRSLVDPFIEVFDGATTDTSCPVRFQTTQPTQALTLLNSAFINDAAKDLVARVTGEVGDSRRRFVARTLELATGRKPGSEALDRGVRFLESFPEPEYPAQPREQFALIALNLNEFLFLD